MAPSVTTVYLPGHLMGLRCVITLSSYSLAGYERVSQTDGERERLHAKNELRLKYSCWNTHDAI